MSNSDASSTVSITFRGSSQSVEDAIKRVSASLGTLDKSAAEASAHLHKTAEAESHAEAEAKGLTRGIEVAADAFALMSRESAEATRRLYEVRSLATDMRGAFGSMQAAIVGGAAAFASVAALGFAHGAVEEALAGEQAQAKLNAALRGNKEEIERVNKASEDGAQQWARYGLTVGQLKGVLASAVGRGLDPQMILGNAKALADLKVALGTDIPGAIDAVTNGPKSAKALSRALNLNKQDAMNLALAMNTAYTANARMAVALQFVEKSRFAGQGDALANTDVGKMATFQKSMQDLQETLGQGLIPLMGNFANVLNSMIQDANGLLKTFPALGDFLGSKWVPIIGLGLIGLKGFLGVVNLIEGLFRTKFISTLMGTRQEIDAGTKATDDYTAALDSIPPDVTTTAVFDDAAAKTEKDNVYIPDLNLVDGRVVTTTAAFSDAQAKQELSTFESGLTAQPLTVPVTYSGALSEDATHPVTVPVVYDGHLSEDQTHPVTVPVVYDGRLSEDQSTPVRVPVIYNGHLTEQHGTPVKVPVIYNGKFTQQYYGEPIWVPVIYNGKLTEQHGVPVRVPVIYNGTLTEQHGTPVHVPVVYDDTHRSNVSGRERVTPQLDPHARQTLQTGLNAQGPLTVKVRPQWIDNAARGLGAGLAGGVAFGITDAIFNGAVTIKQASMPNVHMPPPTPGAGSGGTQTAIFQGPRQPQPVYLVNPGAIGSARGTTPAPTGPMTVQISGHPYVGIVPGQTVKVSNLPAGAPSIASASTGNTWSMRNGRLPVDAHQAGSWSISLNPDALTRFGQMVGEIAIGSALGNIFGGLGLGTLRGFLSRFNKGKGGGGTPGGGGGTVTVPLAEDEVLAEAQQYLKGVKAPTVNPNAPFTFHKGHDPVVDAIKSIDWAGSLKAGFMAASLPMLLAAAVGGALLGGFGSIFSPSAAEAASGPMKKARTQAQQTFGAMAGDIIKGIVNGIKSAAGALAAIGRTIITTLMQGIRNALPGPVQGAFDNLTHNAYKPHGHSGPPDTKKGGPGGGWSSGGIGASGLTSVSPTFTAQLAAMTGLHVPATHGAARAGGHTGNVTINQYISDAHDPHAVAQQAGIEARKVLREFVEAL